MGRPNVGKSSIFNSLLNEDVAIVSQKAGTTRDVVRKVLPLSGFEVEVEDTAGLRPETNDAIEKSGMVLTVKAAESADFLIYVTDDPEEAVPQEFKDHSFLVLNKCDLSPPPPSTNRLGPGTCPPQPASMECSTRRVPSTNQSEIGMFPL